MVDNSVASIFIPLIHCADLYDINYAKTGLIYNHGPKIVTSLSF